MEAQESESSVLGFTDRTGIRGDLFANKFFQSPEEILDLDLG